MPTASAIGEATYSLQKRIAELDQALADQRTVVAELGAVISDYRQRLKKTEAERDQMRATIAELKHRIVEQAQSEASKAEPAQPRYVLNTVEAAAYTGMSKSRLDNLRVAGGGPKFMKLGRSVRYRIVDLDAWMTARLVENTSMMEVPPHLAQS